jgi:hypothetical protein
MKQLTLLLAVIACAGIHVSRAEDAWTEQKTTAPDGNDNTWYGSAAAIRGADAVIGADGDASFTGAAYVLQKDQAGWSHVLKLVPDDAATGDSFGYRVALSDTVAAITSYTASPNGNTSQGAAYIFNRGGSWTQQQKLLADDGVAFDNLGASAAIDGTTVYIGANGAIVGSNAAQGALYEFTLSNGAWVQSQKIIADDGAAFDNFGFSVAVRDGTMFIGAPSVAIDGTNGQGAVYVYSAVNGDWTQVQKLTSSDSHTFGAFGESVAFDGTTLIVGASGASAAYAFAFDGTAWTQEQTFSGVDTSATDNFGSAVALSGNELLISSDIATVDGSTSRGAAYLFSHGSDGWVQEHKFVASDGTVDDFFGAAMAFDGATAILASPHPTIDGHSWAGAAYFYSRDTLFSDGFDGAP